MTRKVILLHGPPACGKLTTARRLAERMPAVILHNHLTFNLARTLFEIGDQHLLDLHRALRIVMLDHALAPDVAERVGDLILTLVYSEPDSVANLAEIVNRIESAGAELRPFYLKCSEATLLARVGSEDRAQEGKLHAPERLEALLASHRYPPLPHPATRVIDNDARSAAAVAGEILTHLGGSALEGT